MKKAKLNQWVRKSDQNMQKLLFFSYSAIGLLNKTILFDRPIAKITCCFFTFFLVINDFEKLFSSLYSYIFLSICIVIVKEKNQTNQTHSSFSNEKLIIFSDF